MEFFENSLPGVFALRGPQRHGPSDLLQREHRKILTKIYPLPLRDGPKAEDFNIGRTKPNSSPSSPNESENSAELSAEFCLQ